MKKKLLLTFLSVWCMLFTFYGQPFQVSTGTPNNPEEKWAFVEDPAVNGYVAIGNANVNGQNQLWISSYTGNGVVVTSNIARDERNLIARDIAIAPYDPQYGNTYYVTGWTDVNGFSQMFVGRISLNGVFLWFQANPFLSDTREMEGVAVTTDPTTGDAIFLGIAYWRAQPVGPQVTLSRFAPNGGLIWSRIYLEKGEWMPREITRGPDDLSADAQEYVITGEWRETPDVTTRTFAARYDGNGVEIWRFLYPCTAANPYYGDAGYDVVFEPRTKNYCIVGAVQTGPQRASVNSTPYILNVDRNGALVAATAYFDPNYRPLGLYPRCVNIGEIPGEVVFAGPNYRDNTTFFGKLPTIAPPGAGLFAHYPWVATANSVAQPFILNDAWPEDIRYTKLTTTNGYIISTNGIPGAFGANDGHFIRTDVNGRTPADCAEKYIDHKYKESYEIKQMNHEPVHLPEWEHYGTAPKEYPVEQRFCQSAPPCDVQAGFNYIVNCKTVSFVNTSVGTGPFTYQWNFGDGNTSVLPNPVHTYLNCGIYTVRLIVCNPVCCDTIIQTVNIPCCTANANFCLTTSGRDVTLSYAATPGTTYTVYLNGAIAAPVWNNNTTRTLPAGTHTICLKAKAFVCNGTDSCCVTLCKTISVSDTCTLAANFSYNVTPSGNVLFSDLSTPGPAGNSYFWEFGTGATSVLPNPVYFYSTPGTYTVCLTVKRPNGADTCEQKICKTIVIDPPCRVKANFKAAHCTSIPSLVLFTNTSTGASSYEWNFGNGVTSTQVNPAYIYPGPGTYIVCLKALANNNCWYRACYKVIVSTVTSSTNCNLLPPNPLFRVAPIDEQPIKVELVGEESSGAVVSKTTSKEIEYVFEPGKLNLFPNPASQQVQAMFLSAAAGKGEVTVINGSGNLVYKSAVAIINGKNYLAIPIQQLPGGVYRVRIRSGEQILSGNFMASNR